jgi:hypothetical protein
MSHRTLLLLQGSDIQHCAENRTKYSTFKKIIIDAGILEQAVLAELDVEFVNLDVGPNFIARASTEAGIRALQLDMTLTDARELIWESGPLQGWDYSIFKSFYVRLLIAKQLGEIFERTFPDAEVFLLRPSNPQFMYFDSFMVTEAFIGRSRKFRVIEEYESSDKWVNTINLGAIEFSKLSNAFRNHAPDAVIHIPTVFSNLDTYKKEILSSFSRIIEIPSLLWDVELTTQRVPLVQINQSQDHSASERLSAYQQLAAERFKVHLDEIVYSPWAIEQQASFLAQRAYLQALTFEGLLECIEGHQPHFVLTDHDTGINGPIFSVAAKLGCKITVLPHSSTPVMPLPHGIRVTGIERDGFLTPAKTVYGQRVQTAPIRFAPRRPMPARDSIACVTLLLNAMVHRGLTHIDLAGLIALHRALRDLCDSFGIELKVRIKPNAPGLVMVAASLGIDAHDLQVTASSSLPELSLKTDLCIAFGEMTTGVIDFLEGGSLVIHSSNAFHPVDPPYSTGLASMTSLCSFDNESAVRFARELMSSPDRYRSELHRQTSDFSSRLRECSGGIF